MWTCSVFHIRVEKAEAKAYNKQTITIKLLHEPITHKNKQLYIVHAIISEELQPIVLY